MIVQRRTRLFDSAEEERGGRGGGGGGWEGGGDSSVSAVRVFTTSDRVSHVLQRRPGSCTFRVRESNYATPAEQHQ